MTTPAFVPIGNLFNNVRYYTQFDPYYYTVDNRPLTDMTANSSTLSNGVDAARRVLMMETFNRDLLTTAENSTSFNYFNGLAPSAPASLTIRIGVGEVLVPLAISADISQTVLKRGINQNYVDLAFSSPVSVGYEVVYTIEYRYVDIGASTDTATYFFNNGNSSIFNTALNGVLEFQIVTGTPLSIAGGLVVPPATTSGWSPLYNLTVQYGESTWYKLWLHDNAPKLTKDNYLLKDLNLRLPASGGGTAVTTYDPLAGWQLANAASQSVVATVNLNEKINLYKDISFKVNFASTAALNDIVFKVEYAIKAAGESLAGISYTAVSPATEIITYPSASADVLKVATLTAKIPGWALNAITSKSILVFKFTRVGADGADTNTGSMIITNITATQAV